MEVSAKTLQDLNTICLGLGWSMFVFNIILLLLYFGIKEPAVKNKIKYGRIEGAKMVDVDHSSSSRPPDPKPLGKKYKSPITEGTIVKGGVNRMDEHTERPDVTPPSLNTRR